MADYFPSGCWDGSILTITTATMTLKFDRGAIIYVKSLIGNEVLLDTAYPGSPPVNGFDWVSYGTINISNSKSTRFLSNSVGDNSTNKVSGTEFQITYSPCYDQSMSEVTDTQITYTFTVDDATGDISVAMYAVESGATGFWPNEMSLPFMDFTGSVLLDTMKIDLDSDTIDVLSTYNDIDSPPCFAILGTTDCMGFWSENTKFQISEKIRLIHTQNVGNTIRLNVPDDPTENYSTPLEMHAGPFRFTCQSHWTEIARRWRERFKVFSSAKFLWENTNWVANIHCFFRGDDYDSAHLAAVIDANSTMVLQYNNMYQIFYGDNDLTHLTTNSTLTAAVINDFATYRTNNSSPDAFPFMGYHSWYRIWNFADADSATVVFTNYDNAGRIPIGYVGPPNFTSFSAYTQDGNKNASQWDAFWSGKVLYTTPDSGAISYRLQPATQTFRDYMAANYPNLCTNFGLHGCIFDVGGTDDGGVATDTGLSFTDGCILMLQDNYADYPIGTEYAGYAWLPYIWFCWEGYFQDGYGYSNHNPSRIVNHPWRAALTGSFFWGHGHKMDIGNNYDYEAYLFGALPTFTTSYDGPGTQGAWRYQPGLIRCQMFNTYELYRDLPPGEWEDGVLAYFRSNTCNYFKQIKRAAGRYAYIEMHPAGDYTRLQWEEQDGVSVSETFVATFADTYTSPPTVKINVNSGDVTVGEVTTSQVTFNVTGTSNFDWLVIGADYTELTIPCSGSLGFMRF